MRDEQCVFVCVCVCLCACSCVFVCLCASTTVCLFRTGEIECMFAESSLTPFPEGANMHPSCPTCFTSLGGARVGPEASPLTTRASRFLTALWASVRLRTSLGLATLWAEKRLLAQQASLSLQPPEDP